MTRGLPVVAAVLLWMHAVCLGAKQEEKAGNLMIVVDSSSSMSELTEDGIPRLRAVKEGLAGLVAMLPEKLNVGLAVFGHTGRKPGNRDIEIVVPMAPLDAAVLTHALEPLKPKGLTPLAASLEMVAEQMADRKGRSCILVVTDGKETCGGDPIGVARKIRDKYRMGVVIDIVGLNVTEVSRHQLRAIAKAGGGGYHDVDSAPGMLIALPKVVEKRTGTLVGPVKPEKPDKKKKGTAETTTGKKVIGGKGQGVLIVRYSLYAPRSMTIFDQEANKEVSGGRMWAHLSDHFKTYLNPGVYALKVSAPRGYEDMRVRNIVIKSGKETVVRLR